MVIDDEAGAEEQDEAVTPDVAGSAYRESLTSVDGFTRGPNGRVKFNKDTKKRRRENEDIEDVEMADAQPAAAKKEKKRHDPKIGHEFKAKVRREDYELGSLLTTDILNRKLAGTSRRVGLTLSLTCRCPRRRKRRGALAWLASVSLWNMPLPVFPRFPASPSLSSFRFTRHDRLILRELIA